MKRSDCTAYNVHVVELAFAVEFDKFAEAQRGDVDANDLCMLKY